MEVQSLEGIEIAEGAGERLLEAIRDLEAIRERLLADEDSATLSVRSGAASALLVATSTLVTGMDAKCTLARPYEDIVVRNDPSTGNLVLRCFHVATQSSGPHCWEGSGKKIRCP